MVDYFRPTPGNSLCDMLASDTKHEFSPDGVTWYTPNYFDGNMGGSKSQWPNVHLPDDLGDSRSFLSFWGSDGTWGSSGCC